MSTKKKSPGLRNADGKPGPLAKYLVRVFFEAGRTGAVCMVASKGPVISFAEWVQRHLDKGAWR